SPTAPSGRGLARRPSGPAGGGWSRRGSRYGSNVRRAMTIALRRGAGPFATTARTALRRGSAARRRVLRVREAVQKDRLAPPGLLAHRGRESCPNQPQPVRLLSGYPPCPFRSPPC